MSKPDFDALYRTSRATPWLFLKRVLIHAGNAFTITGLLVALIVPFLPIAASFQTVLTAILAIASILYATFGVWREVVEFAIKPGCPTIRLGAVRGKISSYSGGQRLPASPVEITIEFALVNGVEENVVFKPPRITDVKADQDLFVTKDVSITVSSRGDVTRSVTFPMEIASRSSKPDLYLVVKLPFRKLDPETLAKRIGKLQSIEARFSVDYERLSGETQSLTSVVEVPGSGLLANMRDFWAGSQSSDLIALSHGSRSPE